MSVVRSISRAENGGHVFRVSPSGIDIFELFEVVLMVSSTLLVFTLNFDTEGAGNLLTNAAIAGFVAFEVVTCRLRNSARFHPTVVMFATFVWFCLCSILWSVVPEKSFSRVESLLIMLAYYLALTNFALTRFEEKERLRFLAKVIVISSFIASLYLLFTSGWQMGERVNGVIGDSNQASAYLSYTVPIALFCAERRLLPKWLTVLDVIVVALSVGVMGSRTGIVVVMLGILLYWLIRSIQRGIISIRTVITILVFAIVAAMAVSFIMTNEIAYEIVGRRFESLFDILSGGSSKINENSYYERQALLDLAIRLFTEHPIIGVGIDGYAYYAAAVIRDTFSHNDYMQLLSCVGIVGFALYYSQHVYIVSKLRNLDKTEFAMCLTLLVMILAFHMTVVFYYQKLEFVFLAFLSCMVYVDKRDTAHMKAVTS